MKIFNVCLVALLIPVPCFAKEAGPDWSTYTSDDTAVAKIAPELFDSIKLPISLGELVSLWGKGYVSKDSGTGIILWRCADGRVARAWPDQWKPSDIFTKEGKGGRGWLRFYTRQDGPGFFVNAAELTLLPDLKSPSANDQKRVSEIREIGFKWWFKNSGLLAEESFRVAGYFSVTRPIAEFAARDDRVWEVRVVHLHTRGPSGVLWINDKTERVIGLGTEEKGKAEPVAPPNAAPPRR